LQINTFAAYFSQQNMKTFFKTLQSTFIPENNKHADIHKTNIKMWECFSTILGYFRVIHNKTTGIPCITTWSWKLCASILHNEVIIMLQLVMSFRSAYSKLMLVK